MLGAQVCVCVAGAGERAGGRGAPGSGEGPGRERWDQSGAQGLARLESGWGGLVKPGERGPRG